MSRRHVGRQLDAALAGYESVHVGQGCALWLPSRVAADVRRVGSSDLQVLDDAKHRQVEEVTRVQSDKQEEAAIQAEKMHLQEVQQRTKAERGWHRVLPQLEDIAKELADPNAVDRTPDKDVSQRRRRTLERLVKLGPDRRVATPPDWRAAVNELEAALPHFRAPIRALRHVLALAESTGTPPRVAPQLLLGPPGLGKTFFTHRVAEMFGSTHGSIQFDQPNAGSGLRGSDKHWANTESGLLFNTICLGEVANPVIRLDEMDKASSGSGRHELDPLAQLHAVLERETAERLVDVSVEVSFDASLAIYVGTANSLRGIGPALVSRMEVFFIEPPDKWAAIELANSISSSALRGLGLEGCIKFERQALYLLSHLSPRRMKRTAEQAIAAAVATERTRVSEADLWRELDDSQSVALH